MRNLPLPIRPATILVLLCALTTLASTGCVRRRMNDPHQSSGAQVFVDDQEVAPPPVPPATFTTATRKLTVIKDGYKTETLYHKFNPPWYQYPPLDFLTENVIPRKSGTSGLSMSPSPHRKSSRSRPSRPGRSPARRHPQPPILPARPACRRGDSELHRH